MKYVLTYASLNLFYGSTSKVASKCFESVAEIEDEGVLSFPALLLFAAICLPPSPHEAFRSLKVILLLLKLLSCAYKKAQLHQVGDILEQILHF